MRVNERPRRREQRLLAGIASNRREGGQMFERLAERIDDRPAGFVRNRRASLSERPARAAPAEAPSSFPSADWRPASH
jgi:hypothetical protein